MATGDTKEEPLFFSPQYSTKTHLMNSSPSLERGMGSEEDAQR